MPTCSVPIDSRLPRVGTTIFTVMSQLAARHGAINLSQGFPDFSAPPALFDLVAKHMHAGANQYAPMAGALALREAIAEKVETLYGLAYDVEQEITVTAGATQAIFTAVAALVRPGDEAIVFEPVYDSYVPSIELNGGRAVSCRLTFPDYRPDWDEVRARITPRTRLIVINTPHNPSGAVWDASDMQALEQLVRGTNIVVVSDEVYEHIVFDAETQHRRHESVVRYPGLAQRSFVVSSFGKTYHVTGWKVAYCLAPRALMAEFRKAHQFIVFCVNHPVQLALAEFMQDKARYLGLADFYQAKRDFFREQLAGSRFALLPCPGTYFQSVRYDAICDEPDRAFVERLTQEHGVAAIPFSAFYRDGRDDRVIRFCFAKNEETLARAGEKLRRV
ncbi:MAG: pyridoxal phosphate-dependent aminotransferase [Zoogloeaceae bacterium]|nr:pyridoxal phosphate-dependent aminotransferase [Zoogloeaceae bacterium]MCK6383893.1 pyridoxal phosphate-dependent aminotransferase [Rhodocyclaceae bacterium]